MGALASYDWSDGSETAEMGQMIGGEECVGGVVVRETLKVGPWLWPGVWGQGLEGGVRVEAVASLGQGAAVSATGQWAVGGWPAYPPSAEGQPHQLLSLQPPSRWPHSCPACHSPARLAPPGPSGWSEEEEKTGEWNVEARL